MSGGYHIGHRSSRVIQRLILQNEIRILGLPLSACITLDVPVGASVFSSIR